MEHPSAHKGSYVRKTPRGQRAARGKRRTREQIDKDNRALDLWCQGMKHREIAAIIGWKSSTTSVMAVQRALADRRAGEMDQIDNFSVAVERIQADIAEQQKIIDTTWYVTSVTGKVAVDLDTGEKIIDPGPKQRALDAKLKLYDQLNKLQGNYAPSKQRVEVVTDDVVQREIDQLAKEIAEAGNGTAVPQE